MFAESGLPEFHFRTSLSLVSPRLAISHSTCLHRSRWTGVGGARDGSLHHRGLLCRSLLGGSCSRPGGGLTQASYWAFSSGIGVLVGLAGFWLRPLGELCPNQVGALLDLALVDQQPVVITALLDPPGEVLEFMQANTGHPIELPHNEGHVI